MLGGGTHKKPHRRTGVAEVQLARRFLKATNADAPNPPCPSIVALDVHAELAEGARRRQDVTALQQSLDTGFTDRQRTKD